MSLLAFWTTRANALNQMYDVALLFLFGQAAPLSLFPTPVGVVGTILPFRWMVSFPVELLLGRVGPRQTLLGLAAQVCWLVVSLVALRMLRSVGVRRYSAVGS